MTYRTDEPGVKIIAGAGVPWGKTDSSAYWCTDPSVAVGDLVRFSDDDDDNEAELIRVKGVGPDCTDYDGRLLLVQLVYRRVVRDAH